MWFRKPVGLVCLILCMVTFAACGPSGANTPTTAPSGAQGATATSRPTTAAGEATEEATEAAGETTEEATEVAMVGTATGEATEEAMGTPTEMAEATHEATSEATEEGTAEAMALDATFTSADNTISFDYPSAWVVEESGGQIKIASSPTVKNATAAQLATGEFRALLTISSSANIPSLAAGASARDVVQAFAEAVTVQMSAAGEATEEATSEATQEATAEMTQQPAAFGEPEELTVGTHDAAMVHSTAETGDSVILAVDLGDDNFAILVAASASGEMDHFHPTLLAMAETITYTPEATAEATGEATEEGTAEATEQSGG